MAMTNRIPQAMLRVLYLSVFFSAALWAGDQSLLQHIQVWENPDSVRVTLRFTGRLPDKYRVLYSEDSLLGKGIELAFLNALQDTVKLHKGSYPKWVRVNDSPEMGQQILRVRIAVDRPVAYRGDWSGNDFTLTLPNVVPQKGSLWSKPWVYVGLGAAGIGGAVLWLTTGKSTSAKATDIAPPDINLPDK